jgi:hypothetical protein
LIGWFILGALCLSPILTFWIGSILSRFLRRERQSRVRYRRRSVEIDRQG